MTYQLPSNTTLKFGNCCISLVQNKSIQQIKGFLMRENTGKLSLTFWFYVWISAFPEMFCVLDMLYFRCILSKAGIFDYLKCKNFNIRRESDPEKAYVNRFLNSPLNFRIDPSSNRCPNQRLWLYCLKLKYWTLE